MPPADVVLAGLGSIASDWPALAVFWHLYFLAVLAPVLAGWRPSRRILASMFVPPVISVSALAWMSGNPFNAGVFALLAVILATASWRVDGRIALASPSLLVAGAAAFLFGFVYPHFVQASSWAVYLYASPLGLVPCPTLAALIGVALALDLARTRWISAPLAGLSLTYAVIGVFRLGVVLDLGLLAGALVLLIAAVTADRRSVMATSEERRRQLPGDDQLIEPAGAFTHAVTIDRPRHAVWPWLAQMGAGSRAGWYSYDLLDNGRQPSSRRIIPALQQLERGLVFPALPGIKDGFTVRGFEPGRFLILGWGPEDRPDVIWSFLLEDAVAARTRLIVRAGGNKGYRFKGLPTLISVPIVRLVHFVMERKQLLGIAERAEAVM